MKIILGCGFDYTGITAKHFIASQYHSLQLDVHNISKVPRLLAAHSNWTSLVQAPDISYLA